MLSNITKELLEEASDRDIRHLREIYDSEFSRMKEDISDLKNDVEELKTGMTVLMTHKRAITWAVSVMGVILTIAAYIIVELIQ